MITATLLALAAGLPSAMPLPAVAAAGREIQVRWRGDKHAASELPDDMPEAAQTAVGNWAAWAEEHKYELHLDEGARVLFVAQKPKSKTLKLIDTTTAFFDEHLPAATEAKAESAAAPVSELPVSESPVSESRGGDQGAAEPSNSSQGTSSQGTTWSSSWGAGSGELDRDTIVLLALDNDDYGSAIDLVAGQNEWLGGWGNAARGNLGFVIENPLCGAWVLGNHENEEYDADAELVHRLTDLLATRRFGRQPYWMIQGLAWFAEVELRRGVWCYPYRREFVFTVEHGAWPTDLRNRVKREFKKESVRIVDLTGLQRGTWDTEAAQMAFGTMSWMARERGEALSAAMHELREAFDTGSRVDLGGGSWERNAGYEVPDEDVQQIFFKHCGDSFFEDLTEGLKALR